jgi:hypothetical protein
MASNREDDKRSLIECLDLIEKRLEEILTRKELFRKEFLEDLPGPWEEVRHHFDVARKHILADQIDWVYLENVGLTSSALAWKRNLLKKAARLGVVRRFLSMADSFLGSLCGGLAVVEFIKEYKEFVESCIKVNRAME